MGVAVHVFEAGLVHVLVGVLGSVVVGVWVLVRNMAVVMRGVLVGVNLVAVVVFVRMRCLVAVLFGHVSSPYRMVCVRGSSVSRYRRVLQGIR